MAALDDKAIHALQDELNELHVALTRKRSEVSNLKLGYIRAVEGSSPLPAEPLRHNLIAARADLTKLEERLAALEHELGPNLPRPAG
jgi:hypothetical protein